MADWKVAYYKRENGAEPVSEFIASLPAKHAVRYMKDYIRRMAGNENA